MQPFLKQISTSQGLSQNSVNSIYEDKTGFIWLSTESGLNRFDSKEFLTLEGTFPELSNHSINSLNIDENDDLWINSNQGLGHVTAYRDKHKLIHFPADKRFETNADMVIGSEFMDANSVSVFTWNGIYYYHPKENDISQPTSMSEFHSESNNILSYVRDGSDFWLGASEGLYFFDASQESLTKIQINPYPLNMRIDTLLLAKKNNILIGGNRGLFLVDLSNLSNPRITQLSQSSVTGLTKTNKAIYFSNWEEVGKVNLETGNVSLLFNLAKVLPQYDGYIIRNIFIDSRQILWIATRSQGVFLWDSSQHSFPLWNSETSKTTQKLSNSSVWSISKANKTDLLIGTDSGLDYFDIQKNEIHQLVGNSSKELKTNELHVFDSVSLNNNYWLATNFGLIRYSTENKSTSRFKPRQAINSMPFVVYSMTKVGKNEIWLATNFGIFKFDPEKKSFEYDKRIMSNINATGARFISSQNGYLWLGIQNKLIRYNTTNGTSKTIKLAKRNILGNKYSVTGLEVEGKKVWVSYRGDGVYLIDLSNERPKTIRHFHTVSQFPDNNIFSLSLGQGFIWAASTQGLIRINTKNYHFVIFDHSDGLPSNEFNEGASLFTEQGVLYLGSPIGLMKVQPAHLKKRVTIQAPKITQIKAINKVSGKTFQLWNYQNIDVENTQTNLTLRYRTVNYLKPQDKEYQYWLNDEQNKQTTRSNQLTLSDLRQGVNIFYIRSRSIGETTYSIPLKLNINVKSEPWFTAPRSLGNYAIIIAIFLLFFAWRQMAYRKEKSLNRKLQESEKRMELALLDNRRGIWDCLIELEDPKQSKFIIFRHEFNPRELMLESYFDTIHPEDVCRTRKAWQQFVKGETDSFLETYRCSFSGPWVWNRIYGKVTAYDENSTPIRATGIWTDITPEKRMEERLNLYSHAFQSTQDIVIILNTDLEITAVNKAYESSTGFSCESLIGKSMVDIAFSRFTKDETNKIKDFVNNNKHWHGESSVPCKNATSFPVSVRVNVISEDELDTGYVVVMNDISHLKDIQEPVSRISFYDPVTGLPNKTLAFDRLRTLIRQCKLKSERLSIIFFSIDHFENIVKILDIDSTKTLLQSFSNRLLPYIQRNDILARYDQDTFIVLQRKHDEDGNIHHFVNQLLREISKPFQIENRSLEITACAGISNYPDDGENWNELVSKAEIALAQTKVQGENLFKYYHTGSDKKAKERITLENRLGKALENHELLLVYQPVLALDSLRTVELDISVRWKYNESKILYPSQFMPFAESAGSLLEISNWVVENALIALTRWNQEGFNICINMNLSVSYLLNPNTLTFIATKIQNHSFRKNSIYISVDEDKIEENTQAIATIAEGLSIIGIGLVLEGYGKSNASIQNLQKLKFHTVKLDRSLVRSIGKSAFSDRVLQGVLSLLNDVRVDTVAKGIETQEQLAFLKEHNCRYGQGYYFSDPLNENQVRQFLLTK